MTCIVCTILLFSTFKHLSINQQGAEYLYFEKVVIYLLTRCSITPAKLRKLRNGEPAPANITLFPGVKHLRVSDR